MKRLTINETWEQSLKMWKWISRRCKGKSKDWICYSLWSLKSQWTKEHGIEEDSLVNDCFFCEYDSLRPTSEINGGCFCPARKIDKDFDCMSKYYSYSMHPRLFYAKLKELNKIRLAKK